MLHNSVFRRKGGATQHAGRLPTTGNSAAPGGYMTQSEELQSIGLCRAPCIKRRFDFDRKKGGSDRGGRLPMQAFRIGLSTLCSLCEHPEPPESCFLRRSDLIGWTSGQLCLMLVLHVSHLPDSGVASRHRDALAEGGALQMNALRQFQTATNSSSLCSTPLHEPWALV